MHMDRRNQIVILLLLISACLAPQHLSAAQIAVEAEDFTDFYDFAYTPIGPYPFGYIVTLRGLDTPGEWVEYTLPVTAYGSYSYSMICWGDYGVHYSFNLYFIPDSGGTTQVITVSFTGLGCFT